MVHVFFGMGHCFCTISANTEFAGETWKYQMQ